MILHNGKILAIDAADNTAQAVAIKADIIQRVGSDDEILPVFLMHTSGHYASANSIDHYQNALTSFAGYKFLIDGSGLTTYCYKPHEGSGSLTTWDPHELQSAPRPPPPH